MPDSFAWPKKHQRLDAQQQEAVTAELRKRYDAGWSIRALATESGRSYGYVHRHLRLSGVAFRPKGGVRLRRLR